jgi:hypothetical protein
MPELLHKELTGIIIGAYYEVYNHTSRTYPEYIYESALMEELRRRGLAVTRQDEYHILYKGRLVGKQRLDLFVVQEIVVENKKTEKLRGLAVKPAKRMQVTCKGTVVGDVAFRHIFVEDKIIAFPVAIGDIRGIHLDNVKDWMRTCNIQLAILANFNALRLEIVFVRA